MKHWIGPWLIAIAVLHTGYAVVKHGPGLREIAARGFISGIGGDAQRGLAAWFVLFGALVLLLGLAVLALEQQPSAPMLRPIGAGLLLMGVAGVALMPASGFWLLFPPALALLLRQASA